MKARVDWADPGMQRRLRRGHWVYLVTHSKFTLATLLGLFMVGLSSLIRGGEWWLLIGAVIIGGLLASRFTRHLASVAHAARTAGPTTYQLSDTGLHVQNALGTWTIAWTHIERVEAAGDLMLVTYAGRSLLSLPDGPLAGALRARWQAKRAVT